jgi:cellulose synthase (UDP-forming)
VEKNLGLLNRMPGENDMFYRVVQKGLDLWNTSFFCGSAALIRRTAVEDVGGFSTESITEDASTSIKMHQKGWKSAYLGIPMVAGLQPETFAGFTVQRLRWAMGMMQIMMKQNPLLIRGLALPQRLAYLSVILFWLFPFARVAFFIAPFLSLFFNLTIYPVGTEFFYAYTVPYLAAVIMSFEKTYGRVRRIIISELYETLQAFYTLPALISTMMSPNAPTFKVTPKGERLDKEYVSEFNKPFYVFYVLTLMGLLWGVARMVFEPESRAALMLSVSWLCFNFVLLSGSLGVLVEKVQRRDRPRVDVNEKVTIIGSFGQREAVLVDVNETGALIRTHEGDKLPEFSLLIGNVIMPTEQITTREPFLGRGEHAVKFIFPTAKHERTAVMLGYGKSSRWMKIWEERESSSNFIFSALGVMRIAVRFGSAHLSRLLSAVK